MASASRGAASNVGLPAVNLIDGFRAVLKDPSPPQGTRREGRAAMWREISFFYRTHLLSVSRSSGGGGGRRARSDSLSDPRVVVHRPERKIQDAPEQRIGEMDMDAFGSPRRTCAAPAVWRAEEANEHFRRPGAKRRAVAMTEGTQNEKVVLRLEHITLPAAREADIP